MTKDHGGITNRVCQLFHQLHNIFTLSSMRYTDISNLLIPQEKKETKIDPNEDRL